MREDAPRCFFMNVRSIKRGRKAHPCWVCREVIPAGQPKRRNVLMTSDDDKPWTVYEHPGCRAFD